MNKNKFVNILLSVVFISIWIIIIYNFSSQTSTDSNSLSQQISNFIIKLDIAIFKHSDLSIRSVNYFVRKFAHFSAYMILSFSISYMISKLIENSRYIFLISISISSLYAFLDEFHQLFVPGRSGEFRDVLIDFSGALIGIALFFIISSAFKRQSVLSQHDYISK